MVLNYRVRLGYKDLKVKAVMPFLTSCSEIVPLMVVQEHSNYQPLRKRSTPQSDIDVF